MSSVLFQEFCQKSRFELCPITWLYVNFCDPFVRLMSSIRKLESANSSKIISVTSENNAGVDKQTVRTDKSSTLPVF